MAGKVYAVARGRRVGYYDTWAECDEQVRGYSGAKYKSFKSMAAAMDYMQEAGADSPPARPLSGGIAMANTAHSTDPNETTILLEQIASSLSRIETSLGCASNDDTVPTRRRSRQPSAITRFEQRIDDLAQTVEEIAVKEDASIHPKLQADATRRALEGTMPFEDYEAGSDIPHLPKDKVDKLLTSQRSNDDLVVYADGSCLSNGQAGSRAGVGAWYGPDDNRNISTHLRGARQTNQRAELTAALMVLKAVDPEKNRSVEIRTDSAYTIGSTTDWMVKYHEKGNPGNKTYQNLDLMSAVYLHARQLKQQGVAVQWTHVKGHSGDVGNDAADALARSGAMRCQNE